MKECSRCKAENYDEAFLCRKCGAKLKKVKNKSLDLDVQNYANPRSKYDQQSYQPQSYAPYTQQQYQTQSYDPYAQQQHQQPYYDPYQGQQFYDPYQAQQYQQAPSQNRGNPDYSNDSNYNNIYGDNSYPNDYASSQSDFTNQSDYYNNYSGTGYNDDSYNNNYNNSYGNDNYNGYVNNDYNSFNSNSFDNNSFDNNGSTYNNQPKKTIKKKITIVKGLNGKNHVFTENSGPIEITDPEQKRFIEELTSKAKQHVDSNHNEPPQAVKEFLANDLRNNTNFKEAQYGKSKTISLSRTAIIILIFIILSLIIISTSIPAPKNVINDFLNNKKEFYANLLIAEQTYDLQGGNDVPYSVKFKLPIGYSLDTDSNYEPHIKFTKDSNAPQSSENNNEKITVDGFIAITNEQLGTKLTELDKTHANLSGVNYQVNDMQTPLGDMTVVSIEVAGCYFYYGLVPIGSDHCLTLYTSATDEDFKTEAYKVLDVMAQNLAKSDSYTLEITDEYCTLTSYQNENIQVKTPLLKDYYNPLNSESNSVAIYERNVNEETVLSYTIRINYQEASKVIEENFSAEKFAGMAISKMKSTEQVDTAMGKMTLINYENGYQNYIGIIPIDDEHSIQISITNIKEEHLDEANAVLEAITQHGQLTK